MRRSLRHKVGADADVEAAFAGRHNEEKNGKTVSEINSAELKNPSEDDGAIFPVIFVCTGPGCKRCAAKRSNLEKEAPDSFSNSDGVDILTPISDSSESSDSDGGVMLNAVSGSEIDWEDLNPNRDVYTKTSARTAQPLATGKGTKQKAKPVKIDWYISRRPSLSSHSSSKNGLPRRVCCRLQARGIGNPIPSTSS